MVGETLCGGGGDGSDDDVDENGRLSTRTILVRARARACLADRHAKGMKRKREENRMLARIETEAGKRLIE